MCKKFLNNFLVIKFILLFTMSVSVDSKEIVGAEFTKTQFQELFINVRGLEKCHKTRGEDPISVHPDAQQISIGNIFE